MTAAAGKSPHDHPTGRRVPILRSGINVLHTQLPGTGHLFTTAIIAASRMAARRALRGPVAAITVAAVTPISRRELAKVDIDR